MLTDDDKQKIIDEVLSSLNTNSKTIEQLTPVTALSATQYFEVSGGKRISYQTLRHLILANTGEDYDDLSTIVQNILEVTIYLDEIDNLGTDGTSSELLKFYRESANTRFRVLSSEDNPMTVGFIEILGDSSHHALTQVMTTHMGITDGELDGTHNDGEIYMYYRSYNVASPYLDTQRGTWSKWKNVIPFLGVESDQAFPGDRGLALEESVKGISSVVMFGKTISTDIVASNSTTTVNGRAVFSETRGTFIWEISPTLPTTTYPVRFFTNWPNSENYGTLSDDGIVPLKGKIYVDESTNRQYRWDGTSMIPIGVWLDLGEESEQAFPGDRGLELENFVETQKKSTISLDDLDTLGTDGTLPSMTGLLSDSAPIRFRVNGAQNSYPEILKRLPIGYVDVIVDPSLHVVTQVFTTHMGIKDGDFDGTHNDGEVYTYYRSYNVSSPYLDTPRGTWSNWKMIGGSSDESEDNKKYIYENEYGESNLDMAYINYAYIGEGEYKIEICSDDANGNAKVGLHRDGNAEMSSAFTFTENEVSANVPLKAPEVSAKNDNELTSISISTTENSGMLSFKNGPIILSGFTFTSNKVKTVNNLEARKLIITNGTSSQFLMADGSLDSTTYTPNTVLTLNGFLHENTGEFIPDNSYWCSDFILLNHKYSIKRDIIRGYTKLAYYDSNKNFISFAELLSNVDIEPSDFPSNAKYVRVTGDWKTFSNGPATQIQNTNIINAINESMVDLMTVDEAINLYSQYADEIMEEMGLESGWADDIYPTHLFKTNDETL